MMRTGLAKTTSSSSGKGDEESSNLDRYCVFPKAIGEEACSLTKEDVNKSQYMKSCNSNLLPGSRSQVLLLF